MRIFDKVCIVLLMTMSLHISPAKAQQLSQDPLYRLVWQDEFDSVKLDKTKWKTVYDWGYNMRNSNIVNSWCGNNWDIAFNTSPPVYQNMGFDTSGTGFHRIINKKESPLYNAPMIKGYVSPCASCDTITPCFSNICGVDSTVAYKFTSSMLKSKYSFTFGYFELRFRFPQNIGVHGYNSYGPEFWMWSSNNNPADSSFYSELDIFEQRATDWKMGPNIHYQNQSIDPFWHAVGNPVSTYQPYPAHMYPDGSGGYGYNGGWHIAGCEWTPEYTDFYYDANDTIRRFSDSKLPLHNLYKMRIIVDCGILPENYCLHDSAQTTWPFYYDLDYVKVYQMNQVNNCPNTSGNFPSLTTNVYTSQNYRDLTVGGSGSAILNSGTFHLAGQNWVLLLDGFEASGTATVIISTPKCQTRQTFGIADDPPQSDFSTLRSLMSTAKQNSNDPK